MLVLSRKINEGIMIGNNIFIRVVDIRNGTVRIGIEAPKDIPIYRNEIQKENSNARTSEVQHDQQDASANGLAN